MSFRLGFILLIFITCGVASAQEITGFVKDKKSKEPIPFASIVVKGTARGTVADTSGHFQLKFLPRDTLWITSVGYEMSVLPIKKSMDNPVTVFLDRKVEDLSGVTIKPRTSRAKVLLKQIIERKDENHRNVQNVRDYNTFERTSVYMAIDSTSHVNRIINNLDDVSMKLQGQTLKFSPIYLAEVGTDITNGTDSILYKKKDGIFPQLNQTIESLILINVVIDLDFYHDQINLLGRGIPSPLSNTAQLNYDYYLYDSIYIDGIKHFRFSFVPKNKYNPLFTGRFTVEDSTFALTSILAYIQETANINFVNGFKANVNYTKTDDKKMFYNNQEISLNLALKMNDDTITRYGSQRIDAISSGNWLVTKTTQYSLSKEQEEIRSPKRKELPEQDTSDHFEDDTYMKIEKLKENSVVKGINNIGGIVLTGYANTGKIEIGPVFDIYSTNAIEGQRFSIPLRTGEMMFERFTVGGFLGYGTRNQEFKYGVNFSWQPLYTDKFIFRAYYSNDYNLVTQDKFIRFIRKNPNTRGNGNFIASVTSKEENPYLKEERSCNLILEYNAREDICTEISPYYLHSIETPQVKFIRNDIAYHTYDNYGLLFNIRLAFGQRYDKYYFTRVYYLDQTPIVNLSMDIGRVRLSENTSIKGLYAQINGSISGKINIGLVFMRYIINCGYLFGDAPYDLLDQPVGSMSLGFSKERYNLLYFASFAHNLYTNAHLDLNGGGIILNHIPLVRTLKLREMISFKCHYGGMNDSYHAVFDLPGCYTTKMSKPYAEIGFGLTNIFKVIRVEYVHQLGGTYINSGFAYSSGIFFRTEMSF